MEITRRWDEIILFSGLVLLKIDAGETFYPEGIVFRAEFLSKNKGIRKGGKLTRGQLSRHIPNHMGDGVPNVFGPRNGG